MGLQMIQTGDRIGLDVLLQEAGVKRKLFQKNQLALPLTSFKRIRSIREAAPGVELMTTFDEEQALEIAKYIDQQNNERKDIVTTIAKEALDLIDPNAPVHILAKQGWHEGVLGIVAGRIMQETGNQPLF